MSGISLVLLAACLSGGSGLVVMPDDHLDHLDVGEDYTYSFASSLRRCLGGGDGALSLLPCLSEGAVSELARADSKDVVHVTEGVSLALEDIDGEKSTRTALPIDRDPTSYRTMLDVLGAFLSRRALHWDLSAVYPGLVLKVASTPSGAGALEFVMDRRMSPFEERKLGTGRLLIRRLVLPLIVGARMSAATLVPLFFLAAAFVAKKALFLSKLAVLASGFLGLNSLFLLQPPQQTPHLLASLPPPPLYLDRRPDRFDGPAHVVSREEEDEVRASGGDGGRNFVWED